MSKIQLIDGKTAFQFSTLPGGQWPALEGTVRPATNREVRAHDARCRDIKDKLGKSLGGTTGVVTAEAVEAEIVLEQSKFYASHLLTWNVEAMISPETVSMLPYEIFRQLDAIVSGEGGLLLKNSDGTLPS